jgi:hypothetical protein
MPAGWPSALPVPREAAAHKGLQGQAPKSRGDAARDAAQADALRAKLRGGGSGTAAAHRALSVFERLHLECAVREAHLAAKATALAAKEACTFTPVLEAQGWLAAAGPRHAKGKHAKAAAGPAGLAVKCQVTVGDSGPLAASAGGVLVGGGECAAGRGVGLPTCPGSRTAEQQARVMLALASSNARASRRAGRAAMDAATEPARRGVLNPQPQRHYHHHQQPRQGFNQQQQPASARFTGVGADAGTLGDRVGPWSVRAAAAVAVELDSGSAALAGAIAAKLNGMTAESAEASVRIAALSAKAAALSAFGAHVQPSAAEAEAAAARNDVSAGAEPRSASRPQVPPGLPGHPLVDSADGDFTAAARGEVAVLAAAFAAQQAEAQAVRSAVRAHLAAEAAEALDRESSGKNGHDGPHGLGSLSSASRRAASSEALSEASALASRRAALVAEREAVQRLQKALLGDHRRLAMVAAAVAEFQSQAKDGSIGDASDSSDNVDDRGDDPNDDNAGEDKSDTDSDVDGLGTSDEGTLSNGGTPLSLFDRY